MEWEAAVPDKEADLQRVKDFLVREYEMGVGTAARFVQRGNLDAEIYEITEGNMRRIFRVYGPYWNLRAPQAHYELALLRHLKSRYIGVAAPVVRRNGETLSQIETTDGERFAALFEYADGHSLWPLDGAHSAAYGAALARLHLASDDFVSDFLCNRYDAQALIDAPIAQITPFLDADDADALRGIGEQIRARLAGLTETPDEWGPIHADIHQGNVHWDSSGAPRLFDFAVCGIGWRIYDITGMLWPLRDATIDTPGMREMCDQYLAGYESIRPLTDAERVALPACVKIRDLWETDVYFREGKPEEAQARETAACLLRQFRARPDFLTV